MITPTSAFATANAVNQKAPILVALLRNCKYAFATGPISGNPTKVFPDLLQGALVGAFTDSAGNVIQPLALGASPITMIVPAGATQLQLGINDVYFGGTHSGSFLVQITAGGVESTVTVQALNGPWLFTGGINAAFPYADSGSIQPTTTCIAATGLVAGEIVQVQYLSGTVVLNTGVTPPNDADGLQPTVLGGSAAYTTGATINTVGGLGHWPTSYMGSTLKTWLVNVADHSTTVNDLDGGVDLADLNFTVQDFQQLLTALFPSYIFEGQRVTLLMGYAGMTIDQFVPFFTGVIDTAANSNANTEYVFTAASFNAKKLSAKIYLTGDDGFPIGSKHPKTINDHPINILVSALGLCGVPLSSIDTNKLYYYRDTIFSGLSYQFTLTSSVTGKDFIESELMKPLGGYLRENNLGFLTANFFYPAISGGSGTGWTYTPPTPPVATLDQTNTAAMPIADEAALIDSVTMRFDDDGTGNGKFLSESTQQYGLSIQKYGMVGEQIIESKGMRSTSQGFLWAAIIARLLFLRYGSKNLLLNGLPFFWSQCLLEPGDIIQLTIAQVPNRAGGTLGVTNMTFEVFDRNWRFMNGITELKLLAIDLSKFKQFLITPNAEAVYASASPTDQAKYMFQCNAAGKYSTGAAANTQG